MVLQRAFNWVRLWSAPIFRVWNKVCQTWLAALLQVGSVYSSCHSSCAYLLEIYVVLGSPWQPLAGNPAGATCAWAAFNAGPA